MRDIETRLKNSRVTPRRPLRPDFTVQTIAKIGEEGVKRPGRRPKWKEYLQMKLLNKPAAALTAVVLAITIGGTAYAAVGGLSGITALFGGQEDAGGGARIVKVDTQNCPHVDAFNITDHQRSAHATYYFKIKPSSRLSNQQVVAMVQGYCEADAEGVVNGLAVQKIQSEPQNQNTLVGGYVDSVITALSSQSLTIRSVVPYYAPNGSVNHVITQTFTKFDPEFVVVNQGALQPFSSLKVGDHIAVSYRATGDALTHSETLPPDQVDASAQTLVYVTKVSTHSSEYYEYQKYHGAEFEQVTPCSKTTSGYCSVEEYYQR